MNHKTIRVVAAVVDTRNLTLYKEDGTTVVIAQGDVRLRKIVEQAAPQLVRNGWADVDISQPEEPSYADFEKEGSGAVKFFRIAKSKLKQLFAAEPAPVDMTPVPPLSIGPVPVSASPTALPDVLPVTPAALTTAAAHLEIMQANADMISDTLGVARQNWVNVVAAVAAAPGADITPAPVVTSSPFPGVGQDGDPQVDDEPEEEVIQHEPSEPAVKHTMNVVNEILKHAVPVSSPEFHEETVAKQGNVVEESGSTDKGHGDDSKPDTIIAVVDGKVIPGMERIKTQFGRAAKLGSTAGVEAFLKRLASTIEARSHSVEDLLKFLERADLPIADDGSILIYKVLRKNSTTGKYVDCHTRKVEQFVGAYVCMDPSLVDHNRNNECSNGLHVARRGYIRSFSGDVCVLAKLAPEDVITIPVYDANKMRVCGYHIIAELSQAQYQRLRENLPITNTEDGQKLLAQMMAGNHIRRTHEVRITGGMGEGVKTTEIPERKVTMADIPASLVSAAADAIEIFGDDELEHFAAQQRASEAVPAPVSDIQNRVFAIVHEQLGVELDDIELDSNLSSDLGADSLDEVELVMCIEDEFNVEIPDEAAESVNTVGDIITYIEKRLGVVPAAPVHTPVKPAPVLAVALSNPDGPQSDTPTDPLDVVKTVAKVTEEVQLSRKEQAKALYDAWNTAADADKADRYAALLAFKKAAKKGWDVLGIPDPTVKVKGTVKVALAPKPNTTPKLFPAVEEVKPKPAHADAVAKLDRKVVKGDKSLPVASKTPPMPKVQPPAETSKEDGPPKMRIAKLLAIGLDSAGIAASVLAIKKSAKKSWEILGVSEAQVAEILKQTGKS
jgi:acyl carrier protein